MNWLDVELPEAPTADPPPSSPGFPREGTADRRRAAQSALEVMREERASGAPGSDHPSLDREMERTQAIIDKTDHVQASISAKERPTSWADIDVSAAPEESMPPAQPPVRDIITGEMMWGEAGPSASWLDVMKSTAPQLASGLNQFRENLRKWQSDAGIERSLEAVEKLKSPRLSEGARRTATYDAGRLKARMEESAKADKGIAQNAIDAGLVTPQDLDTAQQAYISLVQSSPPMLLGTAAAIVTKNPAVAWMLMGGGGAGMQGASTYVEAKQKTGSFHAANVSGLIDAGLEIFGESLPVYAAFQKGVPGLHKFFKVMAAEGGEEVATQFMQDIHKWALYDRSITWPEMVKNMEIAGLAGAGGGAFFGGAVALTERGQAAPGAGAAPSTTAAPPEPQGAPAEAPAAPAPATDMTHQLADGTPVKAHVEDGKPVPGLWETSTGDLVEAGRAEPNTIEPNAVWKTGGTEYEVEVTGKGQADGTARLADGQEIPINALQLDEDAKVRLGLAEPKEPAAPAGGQTESPPPRGPTVPPEAAGPAQQTDWASAPRGIEPTPLEKQPSEKLDQYRARMKAKAEQKKKINTNVDSLTDAIIKLGGINMSQRLDILGDDKEQKHIPFVGYLFSKAGTELDDLATRLQERGYLTQAEIDDPNDNGGIRLLAQRVKEEMAGREKFYSGFRTVAASEEDLRAEAQLQADMDADRQLYDKAAALEGDLNREPGLNISPEEIAADGLDPTPERLAIIDLMRELPENIQERVAIANAESSEADLLVAIKAALKEVQRGTERVSSGAEAARPGAAPAAVVEPKGKPAAEEQPASRPAGETKGPEGGAVGSEAGPEVTDKRIPFALGPKDVHWEEYLDFWAADILGRRAMVWKPSTEPRSTRKQYAAIVAGSGTQLRNKGIAQTLEEAKKIAEEGAALRPIVAPNQKMGRRPGPGKFALSRYGSTAKQEAQEWLDRLREQHGENWLKPAEKAVTELEEALAERPAPGARGDEDYTPRVWEMRRSQELATQMRYAIGQQRRKEGIAKLPPKAEQPKGEYAGAKFARSGWDFKTTFPEVNPESRYAENETPQQVAAMHAQIAREFVYNLAVMNYQSKALASGMVEGRKLGTKQREHMKASISHLANLGDSTVNEYEQAFGSKAGKAFFDPLRLRAAEAAKMGQQEIKLLSPEAGKRAEARAAPAKLPAGVGPEEKAAAIRDRDVAVLTPPEGTAPPREAKAQPTQQAGLFAPSELPPAAKKPELKAKGTPSQGDLFDNVDQAAAQTAKKPTEAQQEAENYRVGKFQYEGITTSIETAAGQKRRPEWPALKDNYGRILGTVGFDKDHVDIFWKPGTTAAWRGQLYVVNQQIGGKFDEHKVMGGYGSLDEARTAYLRNYEKGWDGLDSIIPISVDAFKSWAYDAGQNGPKAGKLRLAEAKRREVSVAGGAASLQAEASSARDVLGIATLPRGQARNTVDEVKAQFSAHPVAKALGDKVSVIQSPLDLPPHVLREAIGSGVRLSQIRGYWDPVQGGQIYVVAGTIPKGEAGTILLHEAVGHYGVAQVLGEEGGRAYNAALQEIYDARRPEIAREVRSGFLNAYNLDLRNAEHQRTAASEYIAHMAETGAEPTLWQKFVATVKRILRKIGLTREWSDGDILHLLQLSRSSLLNGGDASYNGLPAYHQAGPLPIWYSPLVRAIEGKGPTSATPEEWTKFIANARGIKKDELEWTGLKDWLAMETDLIAPKQQMKIRRDDILGYLRQNGVEVSEALRGGPAALSEMDRAVQRRDQIMVQLDAAGYSVEWAQDGTLAYVTDRNELHHRRYYNPAFRVRTEAERRVLGVDTFSRRERPEDGFTFDDLPNPELEGSPRWLAVDLAEVANLSRNYGEHLSHTDGLATRHQTWQLPGGQNYRELLLTVPAPAGLAGQTVAGRVFTPIFISGHWVEPNVLAHVRFNERTDAEGKRVLFVEEIQSDWAEKGRRLGFTKPMDEAAKMELHRQFGKLEELRKTAWPAAAAALKENDFLGFEDIRQASSAVTQNHDWKDRWEVFKPDEAAAIEEWADIARAQYLIRQRLDQPAGVARGPFVEKTEAWTALALKRMIRYAAEQGFDRVAWTTGQQQVDRYSLDRHIQRLTYFKNTGTHPAYGADGTYNLHFYTGPAGDASVVRNGQSEADVRALVGDAVASKIFRDAGREPTNDRWYSHDAYHFAGNLSGVDLRVGGEGMRGFYDKIVPNVANDVLKKLGGPRVGTVTIPATPAWVGKPKPGLFIGREGLPHEQPGFDITSALREQATKAMPLFSLAFNEQQEAARAGPRYVALARKVAALELKVDRAYARGQANAEDLDAQLAELREQLTSLAADVTEGEGQEFDYSTFPEHAANLYHSYLAGKITREQLNDGLSEAQKQFTGGIANYTPATDKQLFAAAKDAYQAYMDRVQARRGKFSVGPRGLNEIYGIRDGRLLGIARRSYTGQGVWQVYLTNGTNENLFARGAFRRLQAGSIGEVRRIFNREGLEFRAIKPRNVPVPDSSIFDQNWVAPKLNAELRQPSTWLRYTIRYLQNRLLLPELYERTIAKEVGPIPEVAKAHREARLAHQRAAGLIADFDHAHTEPILEIMKRQRLSLKDVGLYLYAKVAPEVNAYVRTINPENISGSGMTDERAAQVMEAMSAFNKAATLEQIATMVRRIVYEREQVMIDKGLLPAETVLGLRARYPNYVPLKDMLEDEYIQAEIGAGYRVGRQVSPRFGRFTEAQAEFILPAVIAQAKGTISAGENAEVLRAFLRLVEFAPNPAAFEIERGVFKQAIDKDTGLVTWTPRPSQMVDRTHLIPVPVNGEIVLIRVADEDLAKALNTSGIPVPESLQLLGTMTRFYAVMATGANPEFPAVNFFRDIQQAGIRLSGEQSVELAARMGRDAPAAFWGAFSGLRAKGQYVPGKGGSAKPLAENWHAWYRRYIEAGGHIAYRGLQDVETQHKNFLVKLAEAGIFPQSVGAFQKVRLRSHRVGRKMGVKQLSQLVLDVNGAIENSVRLATFKNAIEMGFNDKDAAFMARNVSVDFNLKGEAGALIGSLYMFFNANIQDVALLFRSLINHPKIKIAATALFFLGMLLSWWNRQWAEKTKDGRNYYDNISRSIKQRNWVIMGPDRQNAIIFPIPFGFGIFPVAGANLMDALPKEAGGAGKPALEAAGDTFVATINALSPFGNVPESWLGALQVISPTPTDPAVQAMTNRDFSDKAIVPERPKQAPPQAKASTYFSGTPEAYIDIAQWLNSVSGGNEIRSGWADVSPNMIQHWVRSIFGSTGAFWARAAEGVGQKLSGKEIETRNMPFVRRFYYEPKDYELSRRFYDNVNQSEVAQVEVQHRVQAGDPAGAATLRQEFQGERKLYVEAMDAERQVAQHRQNIAKIRRNPKMADEEKKLLVEKEESQSREVMQRFNLRFQQTVQ